MTTLTLLAVVLVLAVYTWYESLRLREYLVHYCQRLCREAGLQFLDQSIALTSVSCRRSSDGLPHLYRRYQFEVSEDGTNRFPGIIEVLGRRILSISLQGPDKKQLFLQSGRRLH